MKIESWIYLILFFVLLGIALAVGFQNLSWDWSAKVLWMSSNIFNLVLVVNIFWLLEGIFLTLFIKSFFTTIQRSELSKFDLDRPL
jgi:hypothetical protein